MDLQPNAPQWANLTPGVDFDVSKTVCHTMLCLPLYDGDRRIPIGVPTLVDASSTAYAHTLATPLTQISTPISQVLQLCDKSEMDERQFRKTFDRFDTDRSGAIDFQELRLAFCDLGVDATVCECLRRLSLTHTLSHTYTYTHTYTQVCV